MKATLTVFQEESRTTSINVETIRNGRFTTGDAFVGLHLPQRGNVLFRGVGATVKDKYDKDSPDIAHALAVSRALRQLARNIEIATMDEVHARCASANPLRKMSTEDLQDLSFNCDEELMDRFLIEEAAEAKREECIKAAKKIPKATVIKRREERKAAKRAQRAAKYGIIEEQDIF